MILALLIVACQDDPSERDDFADLDNDGFRERMVTFVREVAVGDPNATCSLPSIGQPLHVVVSMYHAGELVGQSLSDDQDLCAALDEATRRTVAATDPARSPVAEARFVVDLAERQYAMVEYQGRGVELVGGLVPTRRFDKPMLHERIDEGRAYLLRVMNPELGGVHKYYDAPTDAFEPRLHTIYTASTLYTLLAIHARDPDADLLEPIARAAGFLRTMQRVAPGEEGHGAFHYSFDLRAWEREPRFVVGTTAKTIFTLIELHALTEEQLYLDVARLGADWLMTMQAADGRVSAELRMDSDGVWSVVERESLLYTGQVLSALSRLYEATGEQQYLDAGSHTAERLLAKLAGQGCYLGDDYRPQNPISSSWVILSLFDFARASGDSTIRQIVYDCADQLLQRQIDDQSDVYRHGRWQASLSSSGNGWLAEVLALLYLDCPHDDADGCARYRDAVVRLLRLLMQYTYTPENSFVARNPDMARGGLFWNTRDREVRTDSVCHAMNAYVFMIDRLPDGVLIELPEPPLAERLGLGGLGDLAADDQDDDDEDAASELVDHEKP